MFFRDRICVLFFRLVELVALPGMARLQRRVIASVVRGDLTRNRFDTVTMFATAHSPYKASARASRGIQQTRIGRGESGGRTVSGEGECAGLSFPLEIN